jgi:AraC-like DNA-binding protein
MDALGEVLGAVKMKGGVFLDARFTADWCVCANMNANVLSPFVADPVQIISYHYVVQGSMLVAVEGEAPLEVRAGEAVLLARNDPHMVGSAINARPVRVGELVQPGESGGLAQIVHGGGGEPTNIICGYLASTEQRNPLLATLPRLLKIDMVHAGSSEWLEASLRFAIKGLQEGRVGSAAVMSRLSELMLVEGVRGYAATLSPEQKGWLAGMRDPVVGRALALMHGKVSHPWTAEELSREVALSRSAFADRFVALVGMPPVRYLTVWRMQLAQERLRGGHQSIAQIANAVGYEAEEAFTRAFKREFGLPPARWRDQQSMG